MTITNLHTEMDWQSIVIPIMRDKKITYDDLLPVFGKKTRSSIGHYLKGRRKVTIEQLKALADYLEIPHGALLMPEAIEGEFQRIDQNEQCLSELVHSGGKAIRATTYSNNGYHKREEEKQNKASPMSLPIITDRYGITDQALVQILTIILESGSDPDTAKTLSKIFNAAQDGLEHAKLKEITRGRIDQT